MEHSAPDDFTVEIISNGQSSGPVVPPPEPEPVEPSSQGDGDPGHLEPEPDPDPASEAGRTLQAKRGSLQARIDAQTAKQRAAERERDAERERAERAERELQALRQPRQQAQPEPPRYTRPKPTEDEIGTTYQGYGDYVEALADWKLEQREAQYAEHAHRSEVQRRHVAHAQTFAERIAKAEERDPDFWAKMHPAIVDMRPSGSIDPRELRAAEQAARQGHPDAIAFLCRTAIADVIFTSDLSTELMTHFSANPRDLQRLSSLPPTQLYRELGRLEAQYHRPAAASSGPAARSLPVSHAAPPIKPVGSAAGTTEITEATADMDLDDFIRIGNAAEARRSRR